jgi:hypothetical protein
MDHKGDAVQYLMLGAPAGVWRVDIHGDRRQPGRSAARVPSRVRVNERAMGTMGTSLKNAQTAIHPSRLGFPGSRVYQGAAKRFSSLGSEERLSSSWEAPCSFPAARHVG